MKWNERNLPQKNLQCRFHKKIVQVFFAQLKNWNLGMAAFSAKTKKNGHSHSCIDVGLQRATVFLPLSLEIFGFELWHSELWTTMFQAIEPYWLRLWAFQALCFEHGHSIGGRKMWQSLLSSQLFLEWINHLQGPSSIQLSHQNSVSLP